MTPTELTMVPTGGGNGDQRTRRSGLWAKAVLRSAVAALSLLPTIAASATPEPALVLRAGAAIVDITPPESALENGDKIRDPLNVRAIVIDNGQTCAVLVGLDQGDAWTNVVNDAIPRASKALGCPADAFIISATHAHSANTQGLASTGSPTYVQVADAIVAAAKQAKARLEPVRLGYGTTQVNLNVNRDLYSGGKWYQGTNRGGVSDKTLAVVEFLGADGKPVGVYMNYAMHPINMYLSGLISADYPGEASRYIERRYAGAVAIFTQGASGDQNPLLIRPMLKLSGTRTRMPDAGDEHIDATDSWRVSADMVNANTYQNAERKKPVTAAEAAAYKAAVNDASEAVTAMGAIIGESAIDVMRNLTPTTVANGRIWTGHQSLSCPGRDRVDPTARQGVLPAYKDGAPVVITMGLLRIADVDFASINAEVYSAIGLRLKREAPSNRLLFVTNSNGKANSGYVYSNEAGSHLTFQVIGSRLKPDCAEDSIVATGRTLFGASGH